MPAAAGVTGWSTSTPRAGPADGFYDFWSRDRRTHLYHKPGIYRGERRRVRTWLRHLEAERIQVLVIFRLHRAEARYLRVNARRLSDRAGLGAAAPRALRAGVHRPGGGDLSSTHETPSRARTVRVGCIPGD